MAQFIHHILTEYYFWGYAGAFLGAFLVVRNLVNQGVNPIKAIAVVMIGFYAAVLGARCLYLLDTNPGLLISRPSRAFMFWKGGLSWLGGPVAEGIAIGLAAYLLRLRVWETLGAGSLAFPLVHAVARVGCLVRGCCYGKPTSLPWAIYSNALGTYVHPTQAYCMLCEFAVFLVLAFLYRKPSLRKYLFPVYILLSATHRLVTEAFRGGPAGPEVIEGLRFYQSVCLVLFGLSVIVLLMLTGLRFRKVYSGIVLVLTVAPFVFLAPSAAPQAKNQEVGAGNCLVITRQMFQEELAKWISFRTTRGYHVSVESLEKWPSIGDIKQLIALHSPGTLSYVLIVGDCEGAGESGVPWHIPSSKNVAGGVSDAYFVDLNGDMIPECPIGRLPVRSPDELRSSIEKIIAYEEHSVRESARAVTWIDAPAYERSVEEVVRIFSDLAPAWADNVLITTATKSPGRAFLEATNMPVVLSTVISHGSRTKVGSHYELTREDLQDWYSQSANGPMFLLSCFNGQFDAVGADSPCLAEALFAHSGGPIAVVASSGSLHPQVNYALAEEMALLAKRCDDSSRTIGGFYLSLIRNVLTGLKLEHSGSRTTITPLGVSTAPGSEKENYLSREAQILSYNIIGDPASPVRFPPLCRPGNSPFPE